MLGKLGLIYAYRKQLADIDSVTGRTNAENLLDVAEAEVSSGTEEGKRIAKLLPQFRQFVDRTRSGKKSRKT